jgi:hypothetical protein
MEGDRRAGEDARMTTPERIIDFHNHHIPVRFQADVVKAAPANQRARWEVLARRLSDEDLLTKDIREGGLDARVVNLPAALIADAEGRVPHDTIVAFVDPRRGRSPGRGQCTRRQRLADQ